MAPDVATCMHYTGGGRCGLAAGPFSLTGSAGAGMLSGAGDTIRVTPRAVAGHWVHVGPVQGLGAPELVTKRMVSWLRQE